MTDAAPAGPGTVPLDPSEELLWRSFRSIALALPRLLGADLERDSRLSLTQYAVLMTLSEAPDQRLRMIELARRTGVSASRATRLVDELVAAGLLARIRTDGDARGAAATLTQTGRTRLAAAYPAHLASVRRHLLDPLPAAAVPELAAALHAVAERLASAQHCPDRVVTAAEGASLEVSRKHVLQVMRRVGLADRVEEAERLLPDPVDVDRDLGPPWTS